MFRILFLFAFLSLQIISAKAQTAGPLSQPVTIRFQNDSLNLALLKLQTKANIAFAFDPAILNGLKPVTYNFSDARVSDILKRLFFGTGIGYQLYGNQIVIVKVRNSLITISGHLKDFETGEALIGANIFIQELKTGIMSNQYGFYSLTLPEGDYQLVITHIGYKPETRVVHLDKDQTLEVGLVVKLNDLKEIVIDTKSSLRTYASEVSQSIFSDQIRGLPYYAGEEDVIKALQMQNGIKSLNEGSSAMFIRGGNLDQNQIMLDEALIYNPSHLFGLVSIFNPDAIKNVEVYRSYMPANFGGRLSSVIDTRMAEGNNKEFKVKGGVSLLSARVAVEGPTVRDRGSFLIGFRRSLLDMLHYRLHFADHRSAYYDFNVKTNYELDKNNRVLYSFYFGDDYLFSKNSYSNNWGNLTSTLRWNHIFNSRLFSNISAVYSNYKNLLDVNADTLSEKYQWKTGVQDLGLKGDFTFYKNPINRIKFGASTTWHRFVPGETTNAFPDDFNIPRDQSLESAVYITQQITIRKALELNYGIRAGFFRNAGDLNNVFDDQGNRVKKREISRYYGLEPRLNASLLIPSGRVHATYNHNYQYVQLLQNSELAFSSLETWLPSSASIKPQRSDHWAVGYEYLPPRYSASINIYYKKLYNQLDLADHSQIIQNPAVRSELRRGTSDAYGTEINAAKVSGRLTYDLSYIYSRAFRKIEGINDGYRFSATYDIPHELKLNIGYKLDPRISFNTFFMYASGRPLTLPVGYYFHDNVQVPIYEGRNTSRYPGLSRLDLSAHYSSRPQASKKRVVSGSFSIGIYNVFNNKAPLLYRLKQGHENGVPLTEYASGILPWVAYSFKI
ncbi:carboxypeptidase-like regulatory domain-containing protein [Arcticibacter tournemirensis]